MRVLVTGGAGYIGSHTVRQLLAGGHDVVVFDNLWKGHQQAIPEDVSFVQGDIHSKELVAQTLKTYGIDAVVHFAAASLVGESMQNPALYYQNNVVGTLSLLEGMREAGVGKIVFSSTAAVYGEPEQWPITEEMPTCPTNVYGRTKLVIEGILADYSAAYGLTYVCLRYFNAAGAHIEGNIGEDHTPETHLIPLILKTALGQREAIHVFGNNYPTPDGTCIRDYIHVTDLADAHVLALEHLHCGGHSRIYNLGSETGFSVNEVIAKAKQITRIDFPVKYSERRSGDPAVLVASSSRIRGELGWNPCQSELGSILASAWEWHRKHPYGFGAAE